MLREKLQCEEMLMIWGSAGSTAGEMTWRRWDGIGSSGQVIGWVWRLLPQRVKRRMWTSVCLLVRCGTDCGVDNLGRCPGAQILSWVWWNLSLPRLSYSWSKFHLWGPVSLTPDGCWARWRWIEEGELCRGPSSTHFQARVGLVHCDVLH